MLIRARTKDLKSSFIVEGLAVTPKYSIFTGQPAKDVFLRWGHLVEWQEAETEAEFQRMDLEAYEKDFEEKSAKVTQETPPPQEVPEVNLLKMNLSQLQSYALSQGFGEEEFQGMTKAQLRELLEIGKS